MAFMVPPPVELVHPVSAYPEVTASRGAPVELSELVGAGTPAVLHLYTS